MIIREMAFGEWKLKMTDFFKNIKYQLKNKIKVKGNNNKIEGLLKSNMKKNIIEIIGNNNILEVNSNCEIGESEIIIHAENCVCSIGKNSRIKKSKIIVDGKYNEIKLSDGVKIENSFFYINDSNSNIFIGENTTFEGVKVNSQENNNKIVIGSDCMFSYNVEIRNTDSHPVFDKKNKILNKGKKVIVEDMVWIGEGTTVLKGVSIAAGCIIGAKSLVTKNIEKKCSISVGIPSKIIKEDIKWKRNFIDENID